MASINNRSFRPEIKDGYLNFDKLHVNDLAKLEYPMKNYIKDEHLAGGDFRFSYQGSTVVKAEPTQKFGEYFTNSRFVSQPPILEESEMEEIDSL